MSGALWALSAGLGFGLFQSLNRRGVRGMDVFVATFIQLLLSAIVLAAATALTVDLGLLANASIGTIANFAIAGFIHFFVGWTFLNASQKLIGAARTTSLIGTTPLFGAFFAAVTLSEIPTLIGIGGILLIVGGVFLVNRIKAEAAPAETEGMATGLRSLLLGLAAAVCWSISPTFIRLGLAELPSPLLGVTVGVTASMIGYALVLVVRTVRSGGSALQMSSDALLFKIVAGMLIGVSTWMRWVALDLTGVAIVLALSLISVPVVNLLSPFVVGRSLERVTLQVWAGSSFIIAGSLVLIFLA